LDEKGREQGTAILLVGVLEIEVEIGYQGQSRPAHILQISDNFGANQHISLEHLDVIKLRNYIPNDAFTGTSYEEKSGNNEQQWVSA
jgi:hypothetical protein